MGEKNEKLIPIVEKPNKVERAFLVGLRYAGTPEEDVFELLNELSELSSTLEVAVVGQMVANLRKPNSRLLVGSGKAEEIIENARNCDADVIIFDDALSPAQQRNWEKLANMAVIDRQEVILDIFGSRAQTSEAELQVALARAEYDLPRLKRRWTHLHRQRGAAGGMGMRGEGEQQIEVDSRMVRARIAKLQKRLVEVQRQRQVQRSKRMRKPVPLAAIVGYTNSGKSTLLNSLTAAGVLAEDKLFATLDPTVRRLKLPRGMEILVSDTVGFIRKLPHQLVEAFKSTLEEASHADFLIEVLDVSSSRVQEHHETTRNVLKELNAWDGKPIVTVFNKIDLVDDSITLRRFKTKYPDAVFVSAKTRSGLEDLARRLETELTPGLETVLLAIPHNRYDLVAMVHRNGIIESEGHSNEFVLLRAQLPQKIVNIVSNFLIFDEKTFDELENPDILTSD